ncbi:hypothetical protein BJV82DRAFT_606535 [Fennellomyces sp. T-0311]|nr:hypothetical protein BJV82DRAFT_606535 [Fennellomyces sp. T-0311]
MNVPTTPIPCSTDGQQQPDKSFMETLPPSSPPLQSIYTSTFSLIGNDFMECLVRELAHWTQAQVVMVQQLMTRDEYREMTSEIHDENYSQSTVTSTTSGRTIALPSRERSPTQTTFTIDGSPPSLSNSESTTTSSHDANDKFLIVRWSYCSSQPQQPENFLPNTALKLPPNQETPFSKTLRDSVCSIPERSFLGLSTYSGCSSYIGVRLDEDGTVQPKPVGLLCVMDPKPMDTKSLRYTEAILKAVQPRLARELGRAIHEEKLTRAKNAAKMDAENKIKFLADMSHEIRTPMNAVIALTDLLLRERASLNAEQTEHLEVIQTSGHHLLTVINDILDISKINHDPKFKLENRRFSLRKCMKDALNMARHQASMSQPGKIVYVTEYPSDMNDRVPVRQMIHELEKSNFIPPRKDEKTRLPLLWQIDADVPDILMGDTMRLTQIMLNLCSNAVKFTKDGGVRVRIKRCVPTPARTLEQDDPSSQTSLKRRYDAKIETMWTRAMNESDDENDHDALPLEKAILEISVTDTGIGIPADRLPRLFKSFSQIDISTARRYGGTGLGLAISSTLVNHMGGCLWVESEEEVGSCFALTLPMTVARSSNAGLESASTSSMLASPASPALSGVSSTLEDEQASLSSDTQGLSSPQVSPAITSDAEPPQWNVFTPPHRSPATEHSQFLPQDHSEPIGSANIPGSPSHDLPMDTCTGPDDDPKTLSRRPSSHTSFAPTKHEDNPRRFPISKQSYHHHYPHHHHHKKSVDDENTAMLHPIKIMLAEDNVLNQKIAISILKRLGYHDVMVANNGCEVLELMRKVKFDVIFMDLYMPEMDGLEATRAIVAEREPGFQSNRPLLNVADVYIIALTASASRQDRQICIDAGMNDFISKPFTMMEVKASLKNCVNKRKRRRKQQLEDRDDRYFPHPKDDPMTGVERVTAKLNGDSAMRPPNSNGDHAIPRGNPTSSKAAV